MSTLTSEIINLAHQIVGDGFQQPKQDDVEELLADEPLTDIDATSLVIDNEENMDRNSK